MIFLEFIGTCVFIGALITSVWFVIEAIEMWQKSRRRSLAIGAAAVALVSAVVTGALYLGSDDDAGPCVEWQTIYSNNVPYRYCTKHAEPIPAGEQP